VKVSAAVTYPQVQLVQYCLEILRHRVDHSVLVGLADPLDRGYQAHLGHPCHLYYQVVQSPQVVHFVLADLVRRPCLLAQDRLLDQVVPEILAGLLGLVVQAVHSDLVNQWCLVIHPVQHHLSVLSDQVLPVHLRVTNNTYMLLHGTK